jgi:hypothetical protein
MPLSKFKEKDLTNYTLESKLIATKLSFSITSLSHCGSIIMTCVRIFTVDVGNPSLPYSET